MRKILRSEDQIMRDNLKRAVLEGKACPQCGFKPLVRKGTTTKKTLAGTPISVDKLYCQRCNVTFAFERNSAWCDRYEHKEISPLDCRNCDIYQYYVKHKRVDLCMQERKPIGIVSCADKKCTECQHCRTFPECPFYGGRVGEIIRK